MRFRYIPFEVDAERWDPSNPELDAERIIEWLKEKGYYARLMKYENIHYILILMPHTVNIRLDPGEWVANDRDSLGIYINEDFHKMFESMKEDNRVAT